MGLFGCCALYVVQDRGTGHRDPDPDRVKHPFAGELLFPLNSQLVGVKRCAYGRSGDVGLYLLHDPTDVTHICRSHVTDEQTVQQRDESGQPHVIVFFPQFMCHLLIAFLGLGPHVERLMRLGVIILSQPKIFQLRADLNL